MSVPLSLCLSVCLCQFISFARPRLCLSVCLRLPISVLVFIPLSLSMSISASLCLSVCLVSVCLSVFLCQFICLSLPFSLCVCRFQQGQPDSENNHHHRHQGRHNHHRHRRGRDGIAVKPSYLLRLLSQCYQSLFTCPAPLPRSSVVPRPLLNWPAESGSVSVVVTLRAPPSGTFLQRKDVVN